MKILLDEGLPRRAAAGLREMGFDAVHVYDLSFGGAPDEQLLAHAREHRAVIVCLDSNFHRILAQTQATTPSVIRLRVDTMGYHALAELTQSIIERLGDTLAKGVTVTATTERIRVHHLPIGMKHPDRCDGG